MFSSFLINIAVILCEKLFYTVYYLLRKEMMYDEIKMIFFMICTSIQL